MFCLVRNPDHGGCQRGPAIGFCSSRAASRATALLLVALIGFLSGCQPLNHQEPPPNQPRISDLRKEVPPVWSDDLLRPAFPQVGAHVRLLWFHERANLDEVIALIKTDSLPASTTAHWQSNGLLIGTLTTDDESWQRFTDLLPVPIRHRQMTTSMGLNDEDERRLLLRTPLPARTVVNLLDPSAAAQPVEDQILSSHPTHGAQLFANVSGNSANDLVLHLKPHLHQPRARFFDEGHIERQRYGVWLENLQVRWPVETDRLLIILFDPWPEEERSQEQDSEQQEPEQPGSIFGRDIRTPGTPRSQDNAESPDSDGPDSAQTPEDDAAAEEGDGALIPDADAEGEAESEAPPTQELTPEMETEPELEPRPFRFGDALLQHREAGVTLRGMLIIQIPAGPIHR